MEKNAFFEAVEKEFAFLLDEYGFHIYQETYFPEKMGNASVLFTSDHTVISIILDRSQVLSKIGKRSKPSNEWFEITDIVRFFSSDEDMDVYQFSKKNPYDVPSVENQVLRLAKLIRRYCEPVLRGDFSKEEEIKKIEIKRVSAMKNHFKELSKKYSRENRDNNLHPDEK